MSMWKRDRIGIISFGFIAVGLWSAMAGGRVAFAAPAAEPAPRVAEEPDGTEFIRFNDDGKGGGTLEAAIVTYRNAEGVQVDLISALHVGEKSYYQDLSKRFAAYDALLYEMVKPKDADVPQPGAKARGSVSGIQRLMKDALELEFQLDAVDYTPENFVHADLDYETFARLQEERGESMVTLMIRSMIAEMRRQGEGKGAKPITMFDILAAMSSPDSARQYKLLLARQFQDIEAQLAGLEGPEGSVILTERNKAALKVLKSEMAAGKKKLGIFYGAGHMSGLEESMLKEMGFQRAEQEWVLAWDMSKPVKKAKKPPADAADEKAKADDPQLQPEADEDD